MCKELTDECKARGIEQEKDYAILTNEMTKEKIWKMTLMCNDIALDICINALDLYGEPAVGRRFRGVIWLQGFINYPFQ